MRETLVDAYPDLFIGLGGVFTINTGTAKFHVMPDFSPCPINNTEDVNNWLQFYQVSAPLTVLSVLVSQDPGLDLRVEHSHGWGESQQWILEIGYHTLSSTCNLAGLTKN